MQNFDTNINQAISDFERIKDKIVECGVEVADGTPTLNYAAKVGEVFEAGKAQGGGGEDFWDIYQDYGNRINYRYAFCRAFPLDALNNIKYLIKPTASYADGMFYYLNRDEKELFDMTEVCKKIDFSECTSLTNLFYNAFVTNITIDASKATSLSQIFRGGDAGRVDNLTLTVTEACKNYYFAFYMQIDLTEIRFTDGSVIAANIDFEESTKLTAESYHSIITHCSKTASFTLALPPEATVRSVYDAKYGAGAWDTIIAEYSNLTISYS